jgi:DNA repair protein RecN (Recombination protein N)
MLRALHIENFALIEDIDVEFGEGFNVITGETGAGKSILIGALSLILGERSRSEGVRKGAKKSLVEGLFYLAGNDRAIRAIADLGVEMAEELILRREIEAEGRGRCFANDRAITARTLRAIGDLLVDPGGTDGSGVQEPFGTERRLAGVPKAQRSRGGTKGTLCFSAPGDRGCESPAR